MRYYYVGHIEPNLILYGLDLLVHLPLHIL